jgi:uncharacterized protein
MSKDFVLTTSRSDKLRITAFGDNNLSSSPCLILVHGFKGFKDWGFFPYAGNFFADKGYFVLTFNFSHNGVGESLKDFDELDKFAENTFSLEVNELSELIDNYFHNYFGKTTNKRLGLIGHSRGGAIAILTAFRKKSVDAVAVWASVSKLDRYSRRQKEEWKKKGWFEVLNTRTNQIMKLNISLLEDTEKNKNDFLNIEQSVRNFDRPFLIAHGEQDLAVKVEEAGQLFSWADPLKTELFKIKATGHTFDIKHPFEGSNPKFDALLNKTEEFFKQNLLEGKK